MATAKQWAETEGKLPNNIPALRWSMSCCILELRARVEALEAAQQPTIKESLTVAPAGSLVERIAWMIAKNVSEARPGTDCTPFASAAIREVAAWFDQIAAHDNDYVHRAAALLRYEAER